MLRVLNSSSEDTANINVISSMAAHPSLPSAFISGARDGKVSVWDVRCPDNLAWRFLAHSGKLSSLDFSEDGGKILSSGREGVIRLWDTRRLPPNEEVASDFLMAYTGHETYGHWVPAYFLNLEKYVLTGSETNKAFLYETDTGRLAKVLKLGSSKVIFTAPVPESVAFYYVNLSTQTIGLCDVNGEDAKPQEQTPLQVRQNFLKEKMQEVMLDYSDLIISQLHRLGVLESTGLHQIIDTLSHSPDPQSQEILALLMSKYEERVKSSQRELSERIMTNTILPSSIFQVNKQGGDEALKMEVEMTEKRGEMGPKIRTEQTFSKRFAQFVSEETGKEKGWCAKEVHRRCFLCHYCCEDGDP